ncbi:flagellar biosynthesis regulatory protein FlaF [Phaeobacter sp. CECT 5382]|uniref:flagellar biosynthesis regulator FlaF n=1 Tax=Rhodobacterales TaxID=204455 RepID=UPI0006DA3DAF|nr:flagellar biosynthesis regulator FlaF [Phaeobacter sp. CECT 5382]CUH86625.1 flagellar biosynthesis regulatory protein FlaF [Phaeobacter sp. CECT 5382]
MNALLKAKSAYSAAKAPTRTHKDLEFEAVARITHQMLAAAKQRPYDFKTMVKALSDNRKLWILFATDAANESNELPMDLKESIISLAAFTKEHTSKVMSRKANIRPLVEINTAIMRGLRSGAS